MGKFVLQPGKTQNMHIDFHVKYIHNTKMCVHISSQKLHCDCFVLYYIVIVVLLWFLLFHMVLKAEAQDHFILITHCYESVATGDTKN